MLFESLKAIGLPLGVETGTFTFISSLNGLFIIGCTGFLVAYVIIRKVLKKAQLRSGLALLGGAIIAGIAIASSGMINLPSFRYLNAANPFLITTDMLTDSVSEHASTTIDISFFFFSILMVFAGVGAWLLFQKRVNRSLKIKGEMAVFALIIGFLGIYFSAAFVRLEVFGSISIIILSSIGISILISKILKEEHKPASVIPKISFLVIIVALLVVPMAYPEKLNWANSNALLPSTILTGGTMHNIPTNDWSDAMKWLKENTAEDAVIASWWDYGYWISTLAERKTLADNATLIDWQIRKLASMFMSTPYNAWQILTSDTETDVDVYSVKQSKLDGFKSWKDDSSPEKVYDPNIADKYPTLFDYWESELYVFPPVITGLDADYVLINLAVEKLSEENLLDLYTIQQKGGDETKAFWFFKIADLRVFDYYNQELTGYTDKFWNETLFAKLIPFTPILYVDPDNPQLQSETFKPGYVTIYLKDIKFPLDEPGPFQLVYVSPSFERDDAGPLAGPLIYKINKEYNPNQ